MQFPPCVFKSVNDIFISDTAFRKWLQIYNEEGLSKGTNRHGKENPPILPEGVEETKENYKREILKLRKYPSTLLLHFKQ